MSDHEKHKQEQLLAEIVSDLQRIGLNLPMPTQNRLLQQDVGLWGHLRGQLKNFGKQNLTVAAELNGKLDQLWNMLQPQADKHRNVGKLRSMNDPDSVLLLLQENTQNAITLQRFLEALKLLPDSETLRRQIRLIKENLLQLLLNNFSEQQVLQKLYENDIPKLTATGYVKNFLRTAIIDAVRQELPHARQELAQKQQIEQAAIKVFELYLHGSNPTLEEVLQLFESQPDTQYIATGIQKALNIVTSLQKMKMPFDLPTIKGKMKDEGLPQQIYQPVAAMMEKSLQSESGGLVQKLQKSVKGILSPEPAPRPVLTSEPFQIGNETYRYQQVTVPIKEGQAVKLGSWQRCSIRMEGRQIPLNLCHIQFKNNQVMLVPWDKNAPMVLFAQNGNKETLPYASQNILSANDRFDSYKIGFAPNPEAQVQLQIAITVTDTSVTINYPTSI